MDCERRGVLYDLNTGKVRTIKFSGLPLVIRESS